MPSAARPPTSSGTRVPAGPVPSSIWRGGLASSTLSATRAEILAYLFRTRAEFIRAIGREGGESRIWAGIHYPMDHAAGVALGRSVAQRFIDWAESDGSQ